VKIRALQRLPKVSYEFVPVPSHIEEEIPQPALEKLYRILLRLYRRGICNPPMRLLAKFMRKTIRTVQRYIRELVRLGKLLVTAQRVSRDRNGPNIYHLIGLAGGVGDKNVVEKKGEVLTTTTPAPAAAGSESTSEVKPSKTRLEWEARQTKDAADRQMRLQGWVDRGKLWLGMQQRRLDKAYERNRMAMRARIGMNTYDGPQMSDDEVQEIRARIAKREAEAAEQRRLHGPLWWAKGKI
jgi:hypothetical protein